MQKKIYTHTYTHTYVCVYMHVWVYRYIDLKNKPEAKEIGSVQGVGVNAVERREEWEWGSTDEEGVKLF